MADHRVDQAEQSIRWLPSRHTGTFSVPRSSSSAITPFHVSPEVPCVIGSYPSSEWSEPTTAA